MAITCGVPLDIYRYQIFPSLAAFEIHRLSQVTKAFNEIVWQVAVAPQEDIDLSEERVIIRLDGSIGAYLRLKIKMDFLARQPALLDHLRRVRAAAIAAGDDPNCIKSLFTHAFQDQARESMPLIVLFDLNTKQILPKNRKMLGKALKEAISISNLELVKAVLSHPNATNISAKDIESGLSLLKQCSSSNNENKLKLLKYLFSLPNAANISLESLQLALRFGVKGGHVDFVRELFSQTNAANIPAEDISFFLPIIFSLGPMVFHLPQGINRVFCTRSHAGTGLESAFQIALNQNNHELMQLILDQPNADKIEHPGKDVCQIQ